MSAQRDKGTRFESAVAGYLRSALGDDRIERRALHGARDMGDIYGIRAHGFEGIAECKAHKKVTAGLIERWRDQTLFERGNADAGFALLVVKVHRAPTALAEVHLTLRDLARISTALEVRGYLDASADSTWAVVTLADAAGLIGNVL